MLLFLKMRINHRRITKLNKILKMTKGFVYIMLDPFFPQWLKIGKTTKTSEIRAKEIYRKGQPREFVVAYENETTNCDLLEKEVHKALNSFRHTNNREYFILPLKNAIKSIEKVVKRLEQENKLIQISNNQEVSTESWWAELSFVWQQIFRNHLNLTYEPYETEILQGVHNVINHCQNDRLRSKVSDLIKDKKFTQKLAKWYEKLEENKGDFMLFNSYLPYELSIKQIAEIFELKEIDCSENLAVIDLKPLEQLLSLEKLNCMNTCIFDFLPIKNLKKMQEINFNHTKIDTLEMLENLQKLQKISCINTDLQENQIISFQEKNEGCRIIINSFLELQQNSIVTTKHKR